jgi:hypothetical protein
MLCMLHVGAIDGPAVFNHLPKQIGREVFPALLDGSSLR